MKRFFVKYMILPAIAVWTGGGSFAQSVLPGGVSGLHYWIVTQKGGKGQCYWEEKIRGKQPEIFHSIRQGESINGHPALYFDGNDSEYAGAFDLDATACFTCLAVCQSKDADREQSVWSVESDSQSQLVMTTGRMADLTDYNYLNFNKTTDSYPGIFTCIQYKNADETVSGNRHFRIGHKPRAEKLPLESFKGLISEVLLYDRVLSPEERLRVESYLCIKYGLSLEQETPASYMDSRGEVIWDAEDNRGYGARMTVIGRDEVSGLNQRSSESSFAPGLLRLSFSAAAGTLPDNTFLLCSDNGGALKMNRKQGEPPTLDRKWKMQSYGHVPSLPVRMEIVPAYIETPPSPGTRYLLMRDRSGSGHFPLETTDYLPVTFAATASPVSPVVAEDLYFSHPQEVVTLIEAPAFFVRVQIEEPGCRTPVAGRMDMAFVGGESPHAIKLYDENMQLLRQHTSAEKRFSLDNIPAGHYFLAVTDRSGMTCTEELHVNHRDGPLPEVGDSYTLPAGGVLTVVAGASAAAYRYAWTGPDGFKASASQAEIRAAGDYHVSVEDAEGCRAGKTFTVKPSLPNNFQSAILSPNPTKDGSFSLRIHLFRTAPVGIRIYDLQGTLLQQETLAESTLYYFYRGNVRKHGLYLIELSSEGSAEVRKLIYL